MTQIHMTAGESLVYLHRDGGRPWPLDGTMLWRAREWGEFTVENMMARTGDRLTFRQPGMPLIVRLPLEWGLSVRLFSLATCPFCRTPDLHHAEIPDLARWQFTHLGVPLNCYALRTCLVCESSWEQEAI